MLEIGSKAQRLPPPPRVVWRSLVEPRDPSARPWLDLFHDEVDPQILDAEEPSRVVWSSLWPSRPDDEVHLELTATASETLLRFTLLTPDDLPDDRATAHLRYRLNRLLFGDLRFSYGQ